MFSNNSYAYSLKLLAETIRDIFFFPAWWYTRGLSNLLVSLTGFLKDRQKGLALSVWIRNIFKPMYGQFDWQGMLISIVVRLVQIFFRSLVLFFWLIFSILVLIVWLCLPVLVLFEIFYQFS